MNPPGHGLTYIDHLTHNVHRGRMGEWAEFYERLFNFREVRYFDIEGQVTGVKSKAMTSPCGKIRIPINEEGNEKAGQIQEYLDMYHGEGIQHIALGSDDLPATVDAMRASGVKLLDTIDTYYELVDKRIPGHGENVAELQKRKILIDGKAGELLLQIFSENQLGPDLLRVHPAQGRPGFRRRQLQGAVREHRARPDAPRCAGDAMMPRERQGAQPGRGPRHVWRGRPPAARRLCARAAPTTPASRTTATTPRPTTTPTGACTRASCSSCRAWPATNSSPPCSSWARPSASRASTTSPSGCCKATGWQIVCVPGLIPEEAFFALLAARKFPVTDWIRKPEEFDYVVEPDVFHDLFGHVPLLFNPVFADYMQAYGAGGLKASRLDACELLARLYWYTVEFGLIDTQAGPARLRRRHPVVRPANCATASPAPSRGAWPSTCSA